MTSSTRLTVTFKIEDSDIPAKSVTVDLPYIGAAQLVLEKGRGGFSGHTTEIKMFNPILGLVSKVMPMDADDRERAELARNSLLPIYEGTEEAYKIIFDTLDAVLARAKADENLKR